MYFLSKNWQIWKAKKLPREENYLNENVKNYSREKSPI
jgi:hypothetical protein